MEIKAYQATWIDTVESKKAALEPLPTASLQRTQPYYRSKAFISQNGVNPLLAAAAPLFFLGEKLHHLDDAVNVAGLREDLLHELNAFDQQAQGYGYRVNAIAAARFVICLWIDEMVLQTPWGRNSDWQKQPLVEHAELAKKEQQSFFFILNHSLQDVATHIDLLELSYLCLSLGFEGEYRYLDRGYIRLAEIRDHLFHAIEKQRGEVYKQLQISTNHPDEPEKTTPRLWLRGLFLLLVVGSSVGGYYFLNNELNKDFFSSHSSIQNDM